MKNITTKIIIADTNIITDLSEAQILEKFIELDNVYISDIVFHDAINSKTGDIGCINKFKMVSSSADELLEINSLSQLHKRLSQYDLLNFVIARDNQYILATGDRLLKNFAEENGIEVIRTLKILKLMWKEEIISSDEVINACHCLLLSSKNRLPESDIKNLIDEVENNLAVVI